MKIKELEKLLLEKFPAESAEEWDTTGLTSIQTQGPRTAPARARDVEITKVAIALDANISAVREAKRRGCNLLLTHHPAFIGERRELPKNHLIYSAQKFGVALMNFHTALDVSCVGAATLPNLLGLTAKRVLVPTWGKLGFGMICSPKRSTTTLGSLAKKCERVFGRRPRVWGTKSASVKKIVTTTGSVGRLDDEVSVLQACIDKRVDCIICGEIKYHDALELRQLGIGIIDLGHDVSELPLCKVLQNAAAECGIKKSCIVMLNQNNY